MYQYLEFAKNHWLLAVAFLVVLVLIIFEEMRRSIGAGKGLTPQMAIDAMNHADALLVDLRDQHAFVGGHILGSINILGKDGNEIAKKLSEYKGREIILLGKDDVSAMTVRKKLQEAGFIKVDILAGGMMAWKNASLPITKNK